MRSSKSIPSSLNNNNNHNYYSDNSNRNQHHQQMATSQSPNNSIINNNNNNNNNWTMTTTTTSSKQQVNLAPAATTGGPTSPICRCRVMYLGSSVPLITKDGLQGIQEPLRKLYPMDKMSLDSSSTNSAVGIDSWLSVWSNGILIENVDENGREVKRFFKIGALHYCAAVKYIPTIANHHQQQQQQIYSNSTLTNSMQQQQQQQNTLTNLPRFLPLDSPYARQTDSSPPIFASILRRTTGIKVLECHAFICKREAAANALVRCCFHAYADTMYAKQIGADVNSLTNDQADNSGTSFQETEHDFGVASQEQDHHQQHHDNNQQQHNNHISSSNEGRSMARSRSKSIAALNESSNHQHQELYRASTKNDNNCYADNSTADQSEYCSLADNIQQHHHQQQQQQHSDNYSMNGRKSSNEQYVMPTRTDELDWNGNNISSSNLKKQQKLSKSMHYLNNYQNGGGGGGQIGAPHTTMVTNSGVNNNINHFTNPILINDAYPMMIHPPPSTSVNYNSITNRPIDGNFWTTKQSPQSSQLQQQQQQQQQQPFYNNPYASRVPSYPPQEQVDSVNGGGTLKSIRSMAANSIASTLLRSKRHAKSMAQLNKDKIISFHQPQAHHHMTSAHTMMGPPPVMLPPVPPMFLPNLSNGGLNGHHHHQILNGSQTMKLPSRSMVPMMMNHQPLNFEAMTPKEMKKLLKKSAKYGIRPPNFNFNLPPIDPNNANGLQPMLPPLPIRQTSNSHFIHNNGDGTLPLRPPSIYSDVFNGGLGSGGGYADLSPDMAALSIHGLPPPTIEQQQHQYQQQQQMTPMLVKPNQEFLKSKEGKKWLKQQKEFKKLLPPHLDGLPIIFGPPPPDALEPHTGGDGTRGAGSSSSSRNIAVPGCDNNGVDNRNRIYY